MVTGPMEKTPQVQKMVDIYKAVVKEEFGGEVNEWVAGGLTDGNRTAKFIPTLDALGVENYDEHTDHESVDLKTAVPRTAAFAITLAELTKVFQENRYKQRYALSQLIRLLDVRLVCLRFTNFTASRLPLLLTIFIII